MVLFSQIGALLIYSIILLTKNAKSLAKNTKPKNRKPKEGMLAKLVTQFYDGAIFPLAIAYLPLLMIAVDLNSN